MKENNNMNEIIRSKFEGQQHPFEEENWNAMRTIIDQSRKRKQRLLWLVASSVALLFIAGASWGVYAWNHESNTVKNRAAVNTLSAPISAKTPQSGSTVSTHNSATGPGTASIVSPLSNTSNAAVKIPYEQKNRQENHPDKNRISGKTASYGKQGNHFLEKLEADRQVATGEDNISMGTSEAPRAKVSEPANSMAPSATKAPAPPVAKIVTKAPDTVPSQPQRFSDEPRVFMGKTHIISLEAGTEYAGGWQLGSVVQGKGFNFIGGIGYTHYLGHKLFLKTGMLFASFGHMSSYQFNYQHSVGNTVYDSVITTKTLYYARIPLQLEYYIGHKWSLGIGASAWIFLGSSGTATTYQQTDNLPATHIVNYNQNIQLNGYSEVNASAHLLARYTFNEHISAYGIIYYKFTNTIKQYFFQIPTIESTQGFSIIASYNF
jgi:hypothetical protein